MASSVIKSANKDTVKLGGVTFAKDGNEIIVSGSGNASIRSDAYTSIGTLPSAYRPSETLYIPCACGNSLEINATMRIQASGDASLVAVTAVTNKLFAIAGAYII